VVVDTLKCSISSSIHVFLQNLDGVTTKRHCILSDFTRFWVNSLVVVNGDKWRISEFTSLVNGD
jgi:hypothetical protein